MRGDEHGLTESISHIKYCKDKSQICSTTIKLCWTDSSLLAHYWYCVFKIRETLLGGDYFPNNIQWCRGLLFNRIIFIKLWCFPFNCDEEYSKRWGFSDTTVTPGGHLAPRQRDRSTEYDQVNPLLTFVLDELCKQEQRSFLLQIHTWLWCLDENILSLKPTHLGKGERKELTETSR